jgi:hypothetical protein
MMTVRRPRRRSSRWSSSKRGTSILGECTHIYVAERSMALVTAVAEATPGGCDDALLLNLRH